MGAFFFFSAFVREFFIFRHSTKGDHGEKKLKSLPSKIAVDPSYKAIMRRHGHSSQQTRIQRYFCHAQCVENGNERQVMQSIRNQSPAYFAAFILTLSPVLISLPNTALAERAPGENQISALEKTETDKSTAIRIVGTKRPKFTVYRLESPSRIVVEVAEARLGKMLRNPGGKVSLAANSWSVSQVSAHELSTGAGNIVRVAVGLARDGKYQVRANGSAVEVKVKADDPKPLGAKEQGMVLSKNALVQAENATKELRSVKADAARRVKRANEDAAQARKYAATARELSKETRQATERRLQTANSRLEAAENAKRQALKRQERAEEEARQAKKMAAAAVRKAAVDRKRQSKTDAVDQELKSRIASLKAERASAERERQTAYQAALDADARRVQALRAVKRQEELRKASARRVQAAELASKDAEKAARKARAEAKKASDQANRARAKAEKRALNASRKASAAERLAAERAKQNQVQQSNLEALSKERDALKAEVAASKKERQKVATPRIRIRDLQVVDAPRGGRIVISTTNKAQAKVVFSKGKRAVLEISNAGLPVKLAKVLDTKNGRGVLRAVSTFSKSTDGSRVNKGADVVRVVVDLKQSASSLLRRDGNKLYWDFGSTVARRNSRNSETLAAAPKALHSTVPTAILGYGASSTPITQQTVSQFRGASKVYRGRKIDLEYKDADIHNLLRLLADVGAVNMVIPDDITAKVTVRLKNVPWDQALEVILASKKLWYTREGNLVRIDQRDVLDKEAEDENKRRAAARNQEAPEAEIFPLNYASASDLTAKLSNMLSPKGQLQVDTRSNSVIVNDVAGNRKRIIELMRRLDTQTPQIQIEARVVEARTTFNRAFGIQWGGGVAATQATGNSTGLVFPANVSLLGAADDATASTAGLAAAPSNFAVNMPAAIGNGSGGGLGLSLGSIGGNVNVNLRLSALEDNGVIRIISSPKIVTSNNVPAKIKSGVSIPISVVSAGGAQTQFVPADLALDVTAKVSQRDCTVQLVLKLTKNEPDFGNTGARGDPSIITQEANTTLLVADGETAVVGGIYTRNSGRNYSKVPLFSEIPLLGYLFKTRTENDTRNETLLFVTPKVINRASLACE